MLKQYALTSLELEVQRLLAHIDRNQARRFLEKPETPTGFDGWPDFEESRRDAIGIIQSEARKEKGE